MWSKLFFFIFKKGLAAGNVISYPCPCWEPCGYSGVDRLVSALPTLTGIPTQAHGRLSPPAGLTPLPATKTSISCQLEGLTVDA